MPNNLDKGDEKADYKILKEIEGLTKDRFLPIVGRAKGMVLAKAVRDTKPRIAIEIGTLIGYSAILIARELMPEAKLVTIEIHSDEAIQARENLRRAGLLSKVEVMVGDAMKLLVDLKGPFEFAFLDANKSEYLGYLRLLEGKMTPGAVVVADNAGIFADSMVDYLEYVRSSERWKSRFIRVGRDGMEISVKLW
jgi:predicted O-methyltransferase YrrM